MESELSAKGPTESFRQSRIAHIMDDETDRRYDQSSTPGRIAYTWFDTR